MTELKVIFLYRHSHYYFTELKINEESKIGTKNGR